MEKYITQLLWENPDTSKNMEQGTLIELSSIEYDFLDIFAIYDNTSSSPIVIHTRLIKGCGGQLNRISSANSYPAVVYRNITFQSDSELFADTCITSSHSSGLSTTNNRMVISKIYGGKF